MVTLGKNGPQVSRIGLGCMAFSGMYGTADDAASLRTIHAAMERGITLLDTGDFYGMGHNEMLVGRAIQGRRDKVVLSVKFGILRGPDGAWFGADARPHAVKNFAAYSLKRLGVEAIDIYRPGRLDPQVPIEDTMGAIADLVKAGYVKHAGLSEVGVDTIRRAHAVLPIADLQIEYSVASRSPETKLFPVLEELGIGATLYGVLSRGLLAGAKPTGPSDFRAYLPRFAGDNAAKNAALVDSFVAFAKERGMTPAQLALGWVLAKQPQFVALLGARTEDQIGDAARALERPLRAEDLLALEKLIPFGAFAGDRYDPNQMKHLDSER
jgi:aryl-alcohol dehydrogenase-like predicted oxidoreductase